MSSVVISGDTSGSITLAAPAVAGTNTATLPAATGTVMVSGNMPAFSAYQATTGTSLSNGSATKVLFDTEIFDTNNNFASSRFTPTVAGYYQIQGSWQPASAPLVNMSCQIYKNGSAFVNGIYMTALVSYFQYYAVALIYLNGTTDYVEFYAYNNSGGTVVTNTGTGATVFNGALVRTA